MVLSCPCQLTDYVVWVDEPVHFMMHCTICFSIGGEGGPEKWNKDFW